MILRNLGLQSYVDVWNNMKVFTATREQSANDEVWLLEHYPVYTLGQAGKVEHILKPNDIPIVYSDRGGQVTYHGPGQLIAYFMLNIKARKINISQLVQLLEDVIMDVLQHLDITSHKKSGAPGVYVTDKKIASIGLRVKNGYTYHGLALNVDLDLAPFLNINPCGYRELEMVRIKDLIPDITMQKTNELLQYYILQALNNINEQT